MMPYKHLGISSATAATAAATCSLPRSQYDALQSIYEDSNGANWNVPRSETKWSFPSSVNAPCEDAWAGITCSCSKNNNQYDVVDLSLSNYNMIGIISPSIGNLTSLQQLALSTNRLHGLIPSEIGRLTSLQHLYLDTNQLEGSIPAEIGHLTSLQYFYLYSNQLIGLIPNEIGLLTSLQNLLLYSNHLSGSIPLSICNLISLHELILYSNQLNGSIPSEIGHLTSLQYLYLYSNQLTGSIPSEIGQLTSLQYLILYSNQLVGSIPSEIGLLTSLQQLYLYSNQLNGSIPSEIGQLTSLRYLYLYSNQLNGSIPSEIGLLTSLQYLLLYSNQLAGSIPSEIGQLSSLQQLLLNSNQLNGSIPSEIGQLSSLLYLYLYSNQLTGSIPSSIGNLLSIRQLYLNTNQLSGSTPSEIGYLISLQYLKLYSNRLTGSIPFEIGRLTSLRNLGLYSNQLTGSIPSEIGQLASLQVLSIASNQLTGSIPSEIGLLTSLHAMSLYSNHLAGSIPSEIGLLKSLESLYLYSNLLTGSIPSQIGLLTSLQQFYLYSNQLNGSIPSQIGQLSMLQSLNLESNQLTGSIPSVIGQLTSLQNLYVNSNQLTGSIPPEIGLLTSLIQLYINSNQLTGSIPSEIGQLTSIQELNLNSNFFEESIPSSFCSSSVLSSLFLYDNAFTSTVPPCFGKLARLRSLALQSNHLSSSIPASLGNLTALATLLLNDNHLSGTFPEVIGSISYLGQISLSNNLLSGDIFPSISSQSLTSLNIADNLFTGSITANLFSSCAISVVLASGNCLFGSIPETICNVVHNMTIFDFSTSGGNTLCLDNQRIQSHRPPLVHGTFSQLGLTGTIPSCLLSSSSMTALRLSGNRLQGTISSYTSSATSSINLLNLTLDHNGLTGSIPDWVQTHSFLELDLSNNRLDGTLSSDFMVSAYQTRLGLAVNRLSGDLPRSIIQVSSNMSSLNVLSGNTFACNNADLPSQDPSADSYSCGSYELYVSSSTWLGFVGSFLFVVVVVRIVFFRSKATINRSSLNQRLVSWTAAISRLLDELTVNKSEVLSGSSIIRRRYQLILETVTFLLLIRGFTRAVIVGGLILFCIALPIYIGLHPVSSIVTVDYGYVTSMAYLHDIEPVIFVGILLHLLFVIAIYAVRSFIAFIDSIRSSCRSGDAKTAASTFSQLHVSHAWRNYLIFFVLNLINLVVVMSVNIAYVNTIVNATSYNRSELLVIQIGVGLFKVVWNVYVSWSCNWLTTFSSYRVSMRSRYVMSIINYIIAPVISTIVYGDSCFYYVFNSAGEVSSSIVLNVAGLGICDENGFLVSCLQYFPISIDTTSLSSFDYSYACGESLIVAYTPVLISSYLLSGFFQPMLQIVLAFNNMLSRFVYLITEQTSKISSHYNPKVRVKGRDVSVRLMVHSTVLLSFGLAAPLLVIPIVFAMVMDCITCQAMVGKTLHENDIEDEVTEIKHEVVGGEDRKIMNPIAPATIDESIGHVDSAAIKPDDPSFSIKADLLTMEHLDMTSSWRAIDECFHLMIVFVMLFWALLFFDMIADVYGVINGIITTTCFAILPASCLIALDKAAVIPRMIFCTGLELVIDRCMAIMMGSDGSGWNSHLSQEMPTVSAAAVVDGRHDSYRTKSTDVEMMSHPRMNDHDDRSSLGAEEGRR
jgi:Leucine-rich repeat (LRR) protein